MTKEKILSYSYYCAAAASTIGIGTAIGADSSNTISRALWTAGTLGLLAISGFFIGLAFPKQYSSNVSDRKVS